jgi:dihydrofolate synthase / folylpolyglutamate synthase
MRVTSADDRIRVIAERYPRRQRRESVASVAELLHKAQISLTPRRIAIVGTSGKTSTAIYLGRILTAAGIRTGVTVSPHVFSWSERVTVDGEPVDEDDLADELERLDALADGLPDVRFFDLLTLSAMSLFSRSGVETAVCEAGIGGRLDAVRVLEPQLVVVTAIGRDHTELLGETYDEILAEKLGAAPPGATIVTGPDVSVPDALALESRAEGFRETDLRLAQLTAGALGVEPADVPLEVVGRVQRGRAAGVEWIADGAHNEQAWRRLLADLDGEARVAVVSVSADKDIRTLPNLTRAFDEVVCTVAWPGRSLSAEALASLLGSPHSIADPREAVRVGVELARAHGTKLLVFGSIYLMQHALPELEAMDRAELS